MDYQNSYGGLTPPRIVRKSPLSPRYSQWTQDADWSGNNWSEKAPGVRQLEQLSPRSRGRYVAGSLSPRRTGYASRSLSPRAPGVQQLQQIAASRPAASSYGRYAGDGALNWDRKSATISYNSSQAPGVRQLESLSPRGRYSAGSLSPRSYRSYRSSADDIY